MKADNPIPLFNFDVIDRKVVWNIIEKDKLHKYMNQLPNGKYELYITKWFPDRNLDQNGYYWALMTIMENESEVGYTKLEWHELFLDMFAPVVYENDERIVIRTSKMNTVQFGQYVENIRDYVLVEFNVYLPEPDELGKLKY